ncbi:hypothetical protein HanXRQr2_Chr15g0700181 [Helianthus annuus]|uniref:Uncharacterized protein n=1 Tax=Helianthus annuus TaxID=4232 RepID=A0A9K3E141_HELAN|nr:hypothetical protein HanXRQr2_Chr15g0700181 [Helianthus annuus]
MTSLSRAITTVIFFTDRFPLVRVVWVPPDVRTSTCVCLCVCYLTRFYCTTELYITLHCFRSQVTWVIRVQP